MNNSKNCWTVYCHTTPSGKRYIGITSRKPEYRWQNGNGYKNTLFGRAIEKYRWENIKHEIIDTNLTEDEAKRLENEYIEKYRTFVHFSDCNGYNCTLGGEGVVGWEPSEETKNKIGESNKGKPVWNKGKKGKPLTEEHKHKISESNKCKPSQNKGKPAWNKGKTGLQVSWMNGKQHNEESKRKNSESHKGKTPWNKGKTGLQVAHNKGKHLVIIDGKRYYE